jgi:uncharacterized protein YlxW (UPF0749 family)
MSLLDRLAADALDPDYARTAERGDRPDRPRSWIALLVVFALAGLLLAAALVEVRRAAPDVAVARAALLNDVVAQTERTDALGAEAAELRREVAALREERLGTSDAARLQALERGAGGAAVVGPGVEVVLDDAADPQSESPELARVLDRDLQIAVNGLWAAGAEAVAVNGLRLTSRSAIRSAGDAILVDYRPLARPYTITAIGDPLGLEPRFATGPAAESLRTLQSTYGLVFTVSGVDRLVLPAAALPGLSYAQEVP